jgi:general secretion pathway protein C
MGAFVHKYFFALTLLAIALGALLLAKAVNHVIEARVFLEGGAAVPVPVSRPHRKAPPASARATDVTAILQRNIFCSDCPPILPQPATPAEPTSDVPVRTALALQLVATMVSEDPAWSFAAIRDTQISRTGLYGVGSQILPGMPGIEVTAIEDKRVYLANGGRSEYVDLEGVGDDVSPPPRATASLKDDPLAKQVDQGVRKVSENSYDVDRDLINKFLGAPQTLARSARIVPSIKDGQPDGFRLYAIRPDSPYAKIGLMNGDTIRAINGHEITTPDKALEVYSKVRNASHITVSLTRHGESKTLDYSIR